jgi:hypothetical protein
VGEPDGGEPESEISLSPHPTVHKPTQSQSDSVTLLKMIVCLAEYIELKSKLRNFHTWYFDGLERIFERALIKNYLNQIDFVCNQGFLLCKTKLGKVLFVTPKLPTCRSTERHSPD